MISVDIVLVANLSKYRPILGQKPLGVGRYSIECAADPYPLEDTLIMIRDGLHVFARFHKRSKCQMHIDLLILTMAIEDAGRT